MLFCSGLYPLFRSGASDLCGACIHIQVSLNLSSDDDFDHQCDLEGQLSSHESVSGSSSVEDNVQDIRSMISTQDHTLPVKSTQHETNKQLPVTEAEDNTFMAHVIIEQALHLPTVPGDNDARLLPNVYVSYQTLASLPLASTPVVKSSCNPKWEYQKLERISYTSLKSQCAHVC
ncbi:C2 domain-containing protein 3-like isoform X2 [Orbicella faveolata]|uniref:C2 domain-containing protein 3-like isoform X2 n=1 Tax=Orbicella faveolata TaxID=48498 RepID=UPI0009E482B9|nr:C2 domain-containing protein 3-like isoform X2 [Orbicella faveolata]